MSDLERLERLEQSITQLMYEIDSNFSKCHRVITTNILPIVERYAENSSQVWEHSKFWKQFFEASANVSLSGYEEQMDNDLAADTTRTRRDESSILYASELDRRTPRRGSAQHNATVQSPYDLTGENESSIPTGSRMETETPLSRRMESLEISSSPGVPPTPQTILSRHDNDTTASQTPVSSPMYKSGFDKTSDATTPMTAVRSGKHKHNPLLHRVLDSNWKVQATPYGRHPPSTSPTSSPPQLTTDMTVQPGKSRKSKTPSRKANAYDSDDDSSIGQMSPPVTMAFSLPPSKLLRTPAKEAAKYMVDEILRTAGANDLSTIPSEASQRSKLLKGPQDSFTQGTQEQPRALNESRRLFDTNVEETPVVRKGTGVLDNWHESATAGSDWL